MSFFVFCFNRLQKIKEVVFLRYNEELSSWFISDNDCFGTDECWAKCECEVDNPVDIKGKNKNKNKK